MPKLHLLGSVPVLVLLATSSAALAEKPTKLAQIFQPEMIGADAAYFERVSGPAKNTYDNTKIYEVGGCEVTATVVEGSVRSLRLVLSPQCTFNLNTLLPNFTSRFPSPHAMTFGTFDSISGGTGRFYADCLTQCGNAADPVVYEHWQGSRADLGLEIMLEAVQVGEPVLNAANAWQAAMEQMEGEDWVVDAKFNCTRKFDAIAHREFGNVGISAITIGHDLRIPDCQR